MSGQRDSSRPAPMGKTIAVDFTRYAYEFTVTRIADDEKLFSEVRDLPRRIDPRKIQSYIELEYGDPVDGLNDCARHDDCGGDDKDCLIVEGGWIVELPADLDVDADPDEVEVTIVPLVSATGDPSRLVKLFIRDALEHRGKYEHWGREH